MTSVFMSTTFVVILKKQAIIVTNLEKYSYFTSYIVDTLKYDKKVNFLYNTLIFHLICSLKETLEVN
jgi:hypothetical protein